MTVCIGVLCENQKVVVLIADRMITTTGLAIEFEHPIANKITSLSNNCLALTAGNALVHTELFAEVRSQTANSRVTTAERFVEVIKENYQKLRQKQITERVLMPRGIESFAQFYQAQGMLTEGIALTIFGDIERFDFGLEILVGGISPAGGHLFAVGDPGTSHCLDSMSFYVIGSGTNLAMSSLIANQCHHKLKLADAILVALDAKITSENAPGVGRRTDIAIIIPTNNGPLSIWFSDDEIKQLRLLCVSRKDGSETGYADIIEQMISDNIASTGLPPGVDSSTMTNGEEHADTYTTPAPTEVDHPAADGVSPESGDGEG